MGDKNGTVVPSDHIKRIMENKGNHLSDEELKIEGHNMVLLRTACTKMANEDLSIYTINIAQILNVKKMENGCESPVRDKKDWIKSIIDDPSNLQLQKWIFAWLYVRSNYKKLVCNLKQPDNSFEERFMDQYGLQYDEEQIKQMKKNSKTCVQLLYNIRAQSWRDHMLVELKKKLNVALSVTTPRQLRGNEANYRREPNTFYIGNVYDGITTWKEVRIVNVNY